MRQIKFRAWDKKKGVMYPSEGYVALIRHDSSSFEEANKYDDYCGPGLGEVDLMQFTGLLDENGKEIYEGDIVRCFDTSMEIVYDRVVEFFGFREEIWSEVGEDGRTKVEVIGNIWENPELLK